MKVRSISLMREVIRVGVELFVSTYGSTLVAAADTRSPQSWNRYAYVLNQPCSSIDLLGLCNFTIAINNTQNLTDAEAKAAWQEMERLFGLAGLGAVLTPQQADFTLTLKQYPTTVWGSLFAPPAPAGDDSFTWYGANSSSSNVPTNSATIWQNNVEMSAAGMNMGVALGRDMFHEFGHWALNMGPDGTNGSLDQGIMTPGAKGTFSNAYATLTQQQIDVLQQKCKALHGGGGGGPAGGGGYGGIGLIPIFGVFGTYEDGLVTNSSSWYLGVVGWLEIWYGPHPK